MRFGAKRESTTFLPFSHRRMVPFAAYDPADRGIRDIIARRLFEVS
jgi:hypothetical protein